MPRFRSWCTILAVDGKDDDDDADNDGGGGGCSGCRLPDARTGGGVYGTDFAPPPSPLPWPPRPLRSRSRPFGSAEGRLVEAVPRMHIGANFCSVAVKHAFCTPRGAKTSWRNIAATHRRYHLTVSALRATGASPRNQHNNVQDVREKKKKQ